MIPILFEIGPFRIGSYGVMMAIAFLTTGWLLRRELRRKNLPTEWAQTIVVAAALGGIVGARIYFILEHPGEFTHDPLSMIFTGSGLTWYGGLAGGTLGVLWAVRRLPVRSTLLLDLIAPLLLLGYGIGRIGCLLAGDGDYGPPSSMPWAMSFPNGLVPTDVPVHPTPIYETFMSLALFAVLWAIRKRKHEPGGIVGTTLIFFGMERFLAEFWRLTPKVLWGWMSVAQILSLLLILVGLTVGWITLNRKRQREQGARFHEL